MATWRESLKIGSDDLRELAVQNPDLAVFKTGGVAGVNAELLVHIKFGIFGTALI